MTHTHTQTNAKRGAFTKAPLGNARRRQCGWPGGVRTSTAVANCVLALSAISGLSFTSPETAVPRLKGPRFIRPPCRGRTPSAARNAPPMQRATVGTPMGVLRPPSAWWRLRTRDSCAPAFRTACPDVPWGVSSVGASCDVSAPCGGNLRKVARKWHNVSRQCVPRKLPKEFSEGVGRGRRASMHCRGVLREFQKFANVPRRLQTQGQNAWERTFQNDGCTLPGCSPSPRTRPELHRHIPEARRPHPTTSGNPSPTLLRAFADFPGGRQRRKGAPHYRPQLNLANFELGRSPDRLPAKAPGV